MLRGKNDIHVKPVELIDPTRKEKDTVKMFTFRVSLEEIYISGVSNIYKLFMTNLRTSQVKLEIEICCF